MASASGTSGELDDSVPQWKKDLILRKRSQSTGNKNSQQMFLLSSRCNNSSSNANAGSSFIVGMGGGGAKSPPERLVVEGELQPAQTTSATVGRKVLTGRDCVDVRLHCDVQVANNDNSSVVNCVSLIEKEVKMVQDSVIIMRAPIATNGDCCKNGDGSDTSEELQYGPGIVSKLKSKYLSLTLRQANAKSRPSILPMRRATSLENLLDADSADEASNGRHAPAPNSARRYAPSKNIPTSRYRPATRGESQKRARSVETLVRSQSQPADLTQAICGSESTIRKQPNDKKPSTVVDGNSKPFANNCNGTQKINRPKRIAPIMDETERPPTDHVKQTLMIFEGPAVRRTKPPRSTGDVAAKVANFKNIIDQEKPISGSILNNNPKKTLGPKPHITSPKPTLVPKRSSPVKQRPLTSLDSPKNRPTTRVVSPIEIITPPLSPQAKPNPIPDISRDTDPDSHTLSETPDLLAHSTPARIFSPNTVKNITSVFLKEESKTVEINKVSRSPSPKLASPEMVVDSFNKEITKQSMENISKAGLSITYRFNDNISKSHLPRLNTIPIRINRLVPDTPSKIPPVKMFNGSSDHPPPVPPTPRSQIIKPPPKPPQSPILTPTITSNPDPSPILIPTPAPSIIAATNKNVCNSNKPRPPPPVQNHNQNTGKNLTSREIEKNSINKLKTLEQPVSKVVVSMRSVDEVVTNKNISGKGKPRSDQTTILFNFQTRDTVPDYIPTDGSASTRRGKREKPKVN